MKRILLAIILLIFMVLPSFHAWGASPWTETEDYGEKAAAKLGFGLRNIALGWTKILTMSHDALKNEKPFLSNFLEGIAHASGRTVGGALHVATFPLTSLDIPLPENGENLWPYDR
ncbi:MAG: hypothetical protein JW893_01620 [Candidatus Omnitrophica bacterium]|nr:hypothetical protein [Candidatus Omnitrophota bacterium]